MKKIITFVLLLGMTSPVAVFTGCSKESSNKPSELTAVDTVKVTSSKSSNINNASGSTNSNTNTNATATVQEKSKENKEKNSKVTAIYQGRIDNNSIEIKENDEISAARLSDKVRKFFDENSNLKEGTSILVQYEKNEYDQKVITEVSIK